MYMPDHLRFWLLEQFGWDNYDDWHPDDIVF
jgi:hypothetical protein